MSLMKCDNNMLREENIGTDCIEDSNNYLYFDRNLMLPGKPGNIM